MSKKNAYVLEHFEAKQPTLVGIFSSLKKAKKALKGLRKDYSYAIYELPTNSVLTAGKKLRDQQGVFEHWHYGTNEVETFVFGDDDEEIERFTRTELTWPE